jgi:hypothetical protein
VQRIAHLETLIPLSQYFGKGEILPLPVPGAMRLLSVNESSSATRLKVGRRPPVAMDEITSHT